MKQVFCSRVMGIDIKRLFERIAMPIALYGVET